MYENLRSYLWLLFNKLVCEKKNELRERRAKKHFKPIPQRKTERDKELKKSYKLDKPDVEFIQNPKERDIHANLNGNLFSSSDESAESDDEIFKEAKFGLKEDYLDD